MKTIFSGIQPTGKIHIGNYLGAIKNWVDLQDKYECIYCIVDLHAMTIPYDAGKMQESIRNTAIDLLAAGIDPKRSILFVQSHVPQHAELAWILNTITPMSELKRMTQFKEKSEVFKENVNVGLFTYPLLQAADILLYNAEVVPVGKDQVQHIELTRDIARKFNKRFGKIFIEPTPLLTNTPKVMSLKDPTKKMSKSLGDDHYIAISDEPDVIKDKIKKAITDTGDDASKMSPGVENLFGLLKIFGDKKDYDKLNSDFKNGKIKYSELKEVLGNAIADYFEEFRIKRNELLRSSDKVDKILSDSAANTEEIARKTMNDIKSKVGI